MENDRALQRSRAARRMHGGPPGELLLQTRQRAHDVVGRTLGALAGKGAEAPRNGGESITDSATRDRRRKERRRRERKEFFARGGQIREVDLSQEPEIARTVAELYIQPTAIEHFSDVTPFVRQEDLDGYYEAHQLPPNEQKVPPTNANELKKYYKKNPGAKLLVAFEKGENGEDIVVGAVTIVRTQGLNEAKINRVVTKEDKRRKGIANLLAREAIVKAFANPEQGGLGVSSIIIGYILGVEGELGPKKLFEELDFEDSIKFKDRCLGWDNKEGRLVYRDVQQMILHLDRALRRWGTQISAGTSFPKKAA